MSEDPRKWWTREGHSRNSSIASIFTNAIGTATCHICVPNDNYAGIDAMQKHCQKLSSVDCPPHFCKIVETKNCIWKDTETGTKAGRRLEPPTTAGPLTPPTSAVTSTPKHHCGTEYTGTLRTTESGKTCQLWSQSGARSTVHLGAHNFCRNPAENPGDRPWCYTTDPNTRWEYCNTPGCGKTLKQLHD